MKDLGITINTLKDLLKELQDNRYKGLESSQEPMLRIIIGILEVKSTNFKYDNSILKTKMWKM